MKFGTQSQAYRESIAWCGHQHLTILEPQSRNLSFGATYAETRDGDLRFLVSIRSSGRVDECCPKWGLQIAAPTFCVALEKADRAGGSNLHEPKLR